MNPSNTHRKPILLYCSQATQTQDHDDSETEDSDFPPCRVGNLPPLISSHYSPVPFKLHASGILQRQLTLSSEDSEEPSHTQRRRKPNTGLGRSNIVNTIDAATTVSNTKVKVPYIP
jgi:hypothetical protein